MQFPKPLRTPIGAAFLSAVFPGLGQAAAGQPRRGAIVAIPAVSLLIAFVLIFIFNRSSIFGLAVDQTWLTSLLILDVVTLLYHLWAIVDAYLVASVGSRPFEDRRRRTTRHASRPWPALLGVFLVISGTFVVHAEVASVDTGWQHALSCVTALNGCVDPVANGPESSDNQYLPSLDIPGSPGPSDSGSAASPTSTIAPIVPSDAPNASFATTTVSENWAADGQLNVLLLGVGIGGDNVCAAPNSDLRCRLGPDTLMVVHVDLKSGKAAMISVGRNFICTPLPPEMASHFPAGVCPAGQYSAMINSLGSLAWGACTKVPYYPETCGQTRDENAYRRAMRTFETVIGYLLGITIDGSVTINPTGMTTLIDALGGIDVNVGTRIYDKPCGPTGTWQQKIGASVAATVPGTSTCADTHNGYSVPTYLSGVQKMRDGAAAAGATIAWQQGQDIAFVMQPGTHHLNGDWAMAYSRTRIYTTDFARQARQQEVLRSLRKGLDPCTILPRVTGLLGAISTTFNTDMPILNPSDASAWAALGHNILGNNVKSIVLTPSDIGMPFVANYPAVDGPSWAKIKNLVAHSLDSVPAASASGGSSGGGGFSC